jgi:NADH-quinone oxidoreductase subunit I
VSGYFVDTFRSLFTTIKVLFRPPTTVHFPKEKRERAERFRASFALLHDENDEELCIGCLACERICPSDVITVTQGKKRESKVTGKKRGFADDLTLDLNACIFCELCVQVCPTDAIVMVRAPEVPAYSREDLFLSMEKLYENEKHCESSWATGSILLEMQDPKRGQPKPAKKVVKKPKPAQAKAQEPKAGQDKPAEAKPTQLEAEEPKAAEPKAEEPKPVEPKPAGDRAQEPKPPEAES